MVGLRNRGVWALGMLLAMLAALLCTVTPAWAATDTTAGKTSAELSDDGQDYGWLYRKADHLYSLEDGADLFELDGTRWYATRDAANHTPSSYDVWGYYYPDGTLSVQNGGQVNLDAVIRSGRTHVFQGAFATLDDRSNPYPRMGLLKEHERDGRYGAADIRRIVIDADVACCWSYDDQYPREMDRLFEGMGNLTELCGLEHLPTDRVVRMDRMFAGCARLEEFDLASLDTRRCVTLDGMFDGCVSMTTLRLGDGWSQAAVVEGPDGEAQGSDGAGPQLGEPSAEDGLTEQGEPAQDVGDAAGAVEEDGLVPDAADGVTPDGDSAADAAAPEDGLSEEAADAPTDDGEELVAQSYVEDGRLVLGTGEAMVEDGKLILCGPREQESSEPDAHDASVGGYARFPVAMYAVRDGQTVRYEAGEVIPDGAGTYVVADRTHIKNATITLSAGTDARDADSGEPLVCAYTGSAVAPAVEVRMGDTRLVEGSDYELSLANNVEVGTAELTVTGLGAYYGCVRVPFEIRDTAAYAFLYADGLLYVKAGHDLPNAKAVTAASKLLATYRWFDAHAADAGASVPWQGKAAAIKRVIFDESFSRFAPVTAARWFAGCTALTTVEGLGSIDTGRLASMAEMFSGCTALTELNLAELKPTSTLSDISGLVKGCKKLERLTMGNLDATNVVRAGGFFSGTTSLKEFSCGSGWRNAAAPEGQLVFTGQNYRTSPVYARIAKGTPVPRGAGVYRMRDLAMQFATVQMKTGTYTCTGKAIKPTLTVKLGTVTLREGQDYTVTYAHNVYPGKATATIKGRWVMSGGLVVPFTIKARVTHVGDRLSYTDGDAAYTLRVTKTSDGGTVAETELLQVMVTKKSTKTLRLPSSCTIGGAKITVSTISSKLKGNFRNVTTVVVGAKVTSIGSRAFARAGKVKTLTIKSARLKSVKNCLAGSKITKVQTKVKLSASAKKKYKGWFTKKATVGKKVTYTYG